MFETTANEVKIARAKMLNMLINFEKEVAFTGCAFASIFYSTDESESRQVKGKKLLQKETETQITLGSNYEARINRDLVRQGEEANFAVQAMYGKEHVTKLICQAVKDTNKKYICCVVEHHVTPKTQYFFEGQPISYEEAVKKDLFMPSHFTEKKTAGRGNMSEEKDFHFFTLGFEKIIWLKLNGVKYILED
jgi:hypothetical protein